MGTCMKKFTVISTVLFALVAMSDFAPAALVSYEPFSGYNVGELVGQTANGLGYDSTRWWVGGMFGGGATVNNSTSLSYPSLPVAGGSAHFSDGDVAAPFDLAAFGDFHTGARIGDGSVSGDLYIGFMFQADSNVSEYRFAGLALNGNANLLVGHTWTSSAFSLMATGNDYIDLKNSSDESLALDTDAHYFVIKIGFNADSIDSLTVWLDPDLSILESQQDTYMADLDNQADYSFSGIEFRGNFQYAFDEIRVGTEWSDMSAVVPEPSTLALLGCCLAGLLAYAWRKRK